MALQCEKCCRDNREIARYCKYCGARLIIPFFRLENLVGMNDIKQEIQKIIILAKGEKKQFVHKMNLHTILVGNTGTGKTKVGEILCGIFYKYGITTKSDAIMIDAVDYSKFVKDFEQNFQKAKGGILFIDNVQNLVPAGYSSEVNPLDKLFIEMDKSGYDPIVILAGLPKGLKEYLNENPRIKGRFGYIFELLDFDAEQMYQIATDELKNQNFSLNEDAGKRIKKLFKHLVKTKNDSFDNGRLVMRCLEDIIKNYCLRIHECAHADNIIMPEDIKEDIPEEKTVEQILGELDSLVGMQEIKDKVKRLINQIKIDQERVRLGIVSGEKKIGLHMVFTGNPGTGKTTIARKLGEVFQSMGLLDRGHVVEVDRKDLVAGYVGQTATKTNDKINEAMGGILFIDEAYTLAPEGVNDSFGKEAIDTLLKRMEDDRGKFVVIVAGYPKEMGNFININPGLKRRFNEFFHLEDYNPVELVTIFNMMAKNEKYEIEDNVENKLREIFEIIYASRDKNFGNGGEVRNLFEKCVESQKNRLALRGTYDARDLTLIKLEDIPEIYKVEKVITVKDILIKLERLTGLNVVKNEIRNLINYLEIEKARAEQGGKETVLNLHFIFRGNPGTGKTTVARILADVFKAMGLLSKGQLIEVDRAGLVAEYVGQTALKTTKVIDSAIGGVLFIDEAYALASDNFGKEALEKLLKRMEDERGKFIVIAAGYSKEMDDFLSTNPGLTSRFTKHIDFEDYTPDEMKEIFKSMVESKGMSLDIDCEPVLEDMFLRMYQTRDRNFANGRTVRNIFETVLQNQAGRVIEMKKSREVTTEILNTITANDLKTR